MTNSSNELGRYNSMLFDDETMYRTEFVPRKDVNAPSKYHTKRTYQKMKHSYLKDLNTMTDWKVRNIPFDMYWKPAPIIREDPSRIQKRFEPPVDVELEKVRKTRPQLAMTPATSLDAVKDDSVREMLTSDTYTTSNMYFNREIISRLQKTAATKAPLSERLAPPRPIFLPKIKIPQVAPEWRMETVTWDGQQLRAHVTPTKDFWLKRNELKCQECKDTAERQRRMQ